MIRNLIKRAHYYIHRLRVPPQELLEWASEWASQFRPEVPIAFRITGGIGDHLIAARYLRDLIAQTGPLKFDVYSSRPAIAEWIFPHQLSGGSIYNEQIEWERNYRSYALAADLRQYVKIYGSFADWRTVRLHNARLIEVCEKIERSCREIDHHIVRHPESDGYMAHQASKAGLNRYTLAHAMSGLVYGGDLLEIDYAKVGSRRFGFTGKPYVTVHNGFDPMWTNGPLEKADIKSTKVYPHFNELLRLIRREFLDIPIVQLGAATSDIIPSATDNLIGQTTIEETAAILAKASFHIDNESGLVHLASCVGTRSCVLFGPTSTEFFGYATNVNIEPTYCGNCWWTSKSWMFKCPRGHAEPKCLSDQAPERVMDRLRSPLAQTLAEKAKLNSSSSSVLSSEITARVIH